MNTPSRPHQQPFPQGPPPQPPRIPDGARHVPMPPQPVRPQIVRAPHADPFGQFRAIPMDSKRVGWFSGIVLTLLATILLFPFLVDALLKPTDSASMTANEALEETLPTFAEWPVTFAELETCDVVRTDDITVASFDCRFGKVRVTGMSQVSDPELATIRSARMLGYQVGTDARVSRADADVNEGDQAYPFDSDADSYYLMDQSDSADPRAGEGDISYVGSMYRRGDAGTSDGVLLTVEVSTYSADFSYVEVTDVLGSAEVK